MRGPPAQEAFHRPLSRDAYGPFPEKPPGGVVTAMPSKTPRCPIPAEYRQFADAYLAGQEKEKARAQQPEVPNKADPPKKKEVPKEEVPKKEDGPKKEEGPKKEVIIIEKNEKPYRRRRRSSASSGSTRSFREWKMALKQMWRRQEIDSQVRCGKETERKREKEETEEFREQFERERNRCRNREIFAGHHKHRPRHRDRTPLGGDRGYYRTDYW